MGGLNGGVMPCVAFCVGRTPSNGRLTACERFLDGLDAEASLVVPSISILEVFKWALRECSETWSWILIVVDLDSRLALASGVFRTTARTRQSCLYTMYSFF